MKYSLQIVSIFIMIFSLAYCTSNEIKDSLENQTNQKIISGKVTFIENGKDGYTAHIKTEQKEIFHALISISNVGGMENYTRLVIGDKTTLKGETWNNLDPSQIRITEIIDVEKKEIPLLISQKSFQGISPGDLISSHLNALEKGNLRNGEGTFEVFYIKNKKFGKVGYLLNDPNNESLVGNIIIEFKGARTERGIHVGSSFEKLLKKYPELNVHGSEIEGRTYARSDNLSFRLNSNNFTYEVEKDKISKEVKIMEIIINR